MANEAEVPVGFIPAAEVAGPSCLNAIGLLLEQGALTVRKFAKSRNGCTSIVPTPIMSVRSYAGDSARMRSTTSWVSEKRPSPTRRIHWRSWTSSSTALGTITKSSSCRGVAVQLVELIRGADGYEAVATPIIEGKAMRKNSVKAEARFFGEFVAGAQNSGADPQGPRSEKVVRDGDGRIVSVLQCAAIEDKSRRERRKRQDNRDGGVGDMFGFNTPPTLPETPNRRKMPKSNRCIAQRAAPPGRWASWPTVPGSIAWDVAWRSADCRTVMMMNWHPLINKAVDAVRTVAPELRHTPVYIVPAHLLTGREEFSRAWGAIAHPSLDLVVRPHVHWLGRGFATIWSTKNIEEKGPDPLISLLETVVHELAHFFADHHFPFGDVDAPGGRPSKELIEYIHAGFENESSVVEEEQRHAEKVLDSHGLRFIRALAHLKARLERRTGTIISLANLYGYPRPASMQQLCFYAGALAEEVEACQEMTFAEILERPAPSAFLELWKLDMQGPAPVRAGTEKEEQKEEAMNVIENLIEIKDSLAVLFRDARIGYRAAVIATANGRKLGAKELREILRDAEMNIEHFEVEVKQVLRRRELRAAIDRFNREKAEKRRREIGEVMVDAEHLMRESIRAIQGKFEAKRQPLHDEMLHLEAP